MKYWSLVMVILFLSCSPEIIPPSELIKGRWDIYHSLRNGKESKLLENTFFTFQEENHLKSNLFQNQSLTYHIKDDKLIQKGKTELVYHINKLNKDTLVLETKIGRHSYIISLLKDINKASIKRMNK